MEKQFVQSSAASAATFASDSEVMTGEFWYRSAPSGPRGGESNHTLPYNNGVSLHAGPVRVLGASQKLRSRQIIDDRVLSGARSTAPAADAAKFTLTHWSASIDSLPW